MSGSASPRSKSPRSKSRRSVIRATPVKKNAKTSVTALPPVEDSGIAISASIPSLGPADAKKGRFRRKSRKEEDKSDKEERSVTVVEDWDVAVLEREEIAGKYGWGRFTPLRLQCLLKPQFLLVALALVVMSQSFLINGVLPASIPALRRRFLFSPPEVGGMRMMFDAGMVVTFLPVMKLNTRHIHRPRWLGIGCVVMAVGALFCVLPQFIAGVYNPGVIGSGVYCNATGGSSSSPRDCVSPSNFKYYFLTGMFVYGVGAAPYFTVGIAYLDENVDFQTSSLYTGILHACLLVGAILGNLVSGGLLLIHTDFLRKNKVEVPRGPKSEDFVGAWWLSVLVAALFSLMAALYMVGFPERLPGATAARLRDAKQLGNLNADGAKYSPKRRLWKSVKTCLTNVTYLGLIMEQCAYTTLVTSFAIFMPLYFRTVYEVRPNRAALIGGGFVIVSACIGSVTGTSLQRILHFSPKLNLRFAMGACIATLFFLLVFFVDCPQSTLAGVDIPYPDKASPVSVSGARKKLTDDCNRDCRCNQQDFKPICYKPGRQGKGKRECGPLTYFSSCYAGCPVEITGNVSKVNCSCVPTLNTTNNDLIIGGECRSKCSSYSMYAFMLGLAWCAVVIFVRINPIQQCLLRCIPFEDRVVGLTMSAMASRLLGAIPAPAMLGEILQASCAVERKSCGHDVFCVRYDKKMLRNGVIAFGYAATALGITGLALANWFYKEQDEQLHISASGVSRRPRKRKNRKSRSSKSSSRTDSKKLSLPGSV